MNYPVDLKIQYENTSEYRICLRNLFQMNPEKFIINTTHEYDINGMDDESRDELSYDETAASGIMDYIFEKTRNNSLFMTLYEQSAALMFSVDKEIGLSVLLSYDYMADFHNCLVLFLKSPELFNDKTPCYSILMKKVTR